VANLWTEFAAHCGDVLITNGKGPQNPNKLVVAATCEVAKLSSLPRLVIMNPTL